MGTGKTAAAIAAIEKIKNENSSINGAIILTKGPGLKVNFKDELVKITKDTYIPENYEFLTEGEKVRRKNKLIASFYIFYTFFEFAQELSEISDDVLIQNYSNKIIVIDEVHNVRKKDTNEGKTVYVYKQFHRVLHLVKNCKILLMSGTPIKDSVDEFSNILNLILPIYEQLPFKKKFINDFFTQKRGLYFFKEKKIPEIKHLLKGRVSYLKAVTSDVKKVFVGEKNFGTLKYFIVYPDYMSEFQSKYYKDSYVKDEEKNAGKTKKDAVYLDSREASLFVFPDGTYGSLGFGDPKDQKLKNKNNISEIYKTIFDKNKKPKK